MGIFYSFTDWNGLKPTYKMVGFINYLNVFKDKDVLDAYLFTFKFAILTTVIVNVVSLCIALALNSNIKLKNFFKGLYFMPYILSMLIVAYIFNYFFANFWIDIMGYLGIEKWMVNPLGNEKGAWLAIVFVTVWQSAAFNTVLYLAGLQTISEDLYEASALDGANKWKEFWGITFPMIAPFFTINMVLSLKGFLQVFDQVLALTGGGPFGVTRSIALLIYKNGFSGNEFAYQSANAVIYFVVIVAISLIQLRYLQKREMNL
ncbi:sugar ABC transporter permease [Paenibacillus sp. 19GGS1-52]|uniref:ABC transporter permease subunit n=2 Tax=Paenibacillus monticola TaxID=2666075 RepID=A0A7X2H1H8_9BACL|nr:ABC transporter permease subunit [Paenibacillus monticola]ULO10569.1 sugar ABC transporter permease [Paenibacillus sp. 19GGS1-52]